MLCKTRVLESEHKLLIKAHLNYSVFAITGYCAVIDRVLALYTI